MAISRLGPLVGAVSGRVGSVVFRSTRNGPVIASHGTKITSQSSEALTVRAQMPVFNAQWEALSDSERAAWRQLAGNLSKTDRLGVSKNYTARGLALISFWANGKVANGMRYATIGDFPIRGTFREQPTTYSLEAYHGGGYHYLRLTFTGSYSVYNEYCLYSVAINPYGPIRNVRTFRLWGGDLLDANPVVLNDINMFTGKYIEFEPGDRVCVRFQFYYPGYNLPSNYCYAEAVAT